MVVRVRWRRRMFWYSFHEKNSLLWKCYLSENKILARENLNVIIIPISNFISLLHTHNQVTHQWKKQLTWKEKKKRKEIFKHLQSNDDLRSLCELDGNRTRLAIAVGYQHHFNGLFTSSRATRAALRPGAPITPPPGWAPLPHKYSPCSGVL